MRTTFLLIFVFLHLTGNYLIVQDILDQKRKPGIVKRIQKQIAKFELTADDLQIIKA
jgi:hypothetical protein